MSTSSISKPAAGSTLRVLPLLVCFDEEIEVRKSLVDIQRYRQVSFESALKLPADAERIVISGDESLLLRFYEEIRKPSCRLIALTNHRFHDPRLDALVYAYLPTNTPHALLERTVDNALDHIHLIHVREQINERLRGVTREIQELNKIGAALSAEHHLDRLLELILTKAGTSRMQMQARYTWSSQHGKRSISGRTMQYCRQTQMVPAGYLRPRS